MAVVSIPHYEPWIVARWAMRLLTDRATVFCDRCEDRLVLERASALDGLHFDLLPADQASRVATALTQAATELRSEHIQGPEQRDREFAERLDVLNLRLSDLTGD